jgi:hypothetical protein
VYYVRFVILWAMAILLAGLPLYCLATWFGFLAIPVLNWLLYSAWFGVGFGLFILPAAARELRDPRDAPVIALFYPNFLLGMGLVLMLTAVSCCVFFK